MIKKEELSLMRRLLLAVAVAGGGVALDLGSTLRAAQDPVAKFRAETNVVEVDTRVFDAQGHFVRDLTASDFELYEDGKLQPITNVEYVDIRSIAGAQPDSAPTVPSDVSSNERTGTPGRYY